MEIERNRVHSRAASLAPYAVHGDEADVLTCRTYLETSHPYRNPFQRDRARIIHSRAFRRLAGKTQVFTRRSSDHFRSRLTHTMEVAQIARAIASALHLNEDLVEALALVHDIGHPPFGHAGERALDRCLRQHGLFFDHNLHALRIVEYFEHRNAAFRGLNLTLAVREGIIKHSRGYTLEEHPELAEYFLDQRPPLEAQIIDWADEIAYLTADLDDGLESGILTIGSVCANVPIVEQFFKEAAAQYHDTIEPLLINETLKRVLNALVDDLIRETERHIAELCPQSLVDIRNAPSRLLGFSPAMDYQRITAKGYLYQTLYTSPELVAAHEEADRIISTLFRCWLEHPRQLPDACRAHLAHDGLVRTIADYIAGMTDQFIIAQYQSLQLECQAGQAI